MKYLIIVSLFISLFSEIAIEAKTYSIIDYGAEPDTSKLSTQAIQKAIDLCSQNGGGRVVIPSGQYKSGTFLLKSNVNLFLEAGAILYGSTNLNDYTDLKPGFVSLRTQEATKQLIFAENQTNISITGFGEINGQGKYFKKMSWNDEGITRPHLLRFINCNDIIVEGISLKNSACWMQHYLACERVQIRGLRIFNRNNYNNDAIDLDGCKDVTVSDIISDSDDDGITLKSTSDRMCENIAITNCVISSRCNAIKMGTESNGGFRNITVSNVVVQPSHYQKTAFYGSVHGTSGITLEIVDGGIMENITINNINIEETESPIFIRLANRARPYKKDMVIDHIGDLRDISISNIRIKNAQNIGCSITGQPNHPVKNVTLNNIVFHHQGGGTKEDSEKKIEELPDQYPEATMFGVLPTQGFYIRHAENIKIDGLQIQTIKDDFRPFIIIDDVQESMLSTISSNNKCSLSSAFKFENSSSIIIINCTFNNNAPVFIEAIGNETSNIVVVNNIVLGIEKLINPSFEKVVQDQGNLIFKH